MSLHRKTLSPNRSEVSWDGRPTRAMGMPTCAMGMCVRWKTLSASQFGRLANASPRYGRLYDRWFGDWDGLSRTGFGQINRTVDMARRSRNRYRSESVSRFLVHADIALTAGTGEQNELLDVGRREALDQAEKVRTDPTSGKVRSDHESAYLPVGALASAAHCGDQTSALAYDECGPCRRPGQDLLMGFPQGGNIQGLVEQGLLNPAASLQDNEFGKVVDGESGDCGVGQHGRESIAR